MPLDWPTYYPNHLIPQTAKVVAEAVKKFPEQTQITELCESVVSTLTPHFCAAVQGKTLSADLALYEMRKLLDCLLGYNCDDPSERYRLLKKVVNSDEWLNLAGEIARVHSAAQPSLATVANVGGRERGAATKKSRRGTDRKGDPTLLDRKDRVSFRTAEQYLGITERQRQHLVKSGALIVKGQGNNRKVTTESLRKYLPPENPK